ncbi:MAG TPA: hypothetical protein VIJ94_00955 [Caulobacteraceae bacterium]
MAYRPEWDAPVEDGVYLGWPAEKYFRQETRGSSDWIKIFRQLEGWWWASRYNPDWKRTETDEQNYGSALHAIILEGLRAYAARYAIEPSKHNYRGLVTTIEEMKAAIDQAGRSIDGTSKWKAPDWAVAMASALPDVPCWYNILEDFRAHIGTRPVVSDVEDRMLRLMHRIATDPNRPDNVAIRKLLQDTEDHPALAEVTIFATIDGIRRRWRIDRMYPGIDMDLKSLGNWRGRPLKFEVGQVLAQNCWDIQRADYWIGRHEAYRLIREGQLFGGTLEQRAYIKEIVETEPTWDWVWLVYQKPELSGRAPVIFPLWDKSWSRDGQQPGDLRLYGDRKLRKAISFYQDAVAKWGLEEPWAKVEDLHFTEPAKDVPSIVLPHWVQEDEPSEEAAYATS